jgi:hypothetical protein
MQISCIVMTYLRAVPMYGLFPFPSWCCLKTFLGCNFGQEVPRPRGAALRPTVILLFHARLMLPLCESSIPSMI